ncbi:coenzyme F420-0:L-glutamate ligase / coenzyme F420-1:gamma-L-glutamate ligase [Quadrisphaera granulorum]|uniref:Coenzyme F420-0:L-glutamate ligase/coenzyme F420-1:gamma-L-glutamate ligase n=1 Tax=Quadrisphaera granulorum TaxID=317664 RepID=A0A316A5A2_9ACTN|nr:coenzyme F420-0:L-glutamate ligase [Quadrisphaera granulorum]PWJ53071.1 coenzyme F420-0:L-glutamate ligase/coenzyme F420-1:gamma-L-glutamate ligase [Quadrisphaera granulorum]SZE97236.1 coenzyme F420-0:L-glutamate ligase / coenzyme F420-1:gamma-L-glutamate ligase [Quadrisphaera granulorum]
MSAPHPGPPSGASTPLPPPAEVVALSVPGLPEIGSSDDLAGLIARACAAAGIALGASDVVVVASKVVAKAEGRSIPAAERERALDRESVRLVAERGLPDGRTTRVVQSRSGPVMAAAGIDASDVAEGTVLLLPADPDASARALRSRLRALLEPQLAGGAPAVVVSDTSGRPWRDGVTDFALGAAGLEVLDDARGRLDRSGRVMEVTVRGVADEVAALADLVKGKAAGTPVAVVRGLGAHVSDDDGDGAARLVRTGPADWFAFGHVEAVRAALGLDEREVAPPPIAPGGPVRDRVARAVDVAAAGRGLGAAAVSSDGEVLAVSGPAYDVGVAVERLRVALWAERLDADVVPGAVRTVDGEELVDASVAVELRVRERS